MVGCDGGRGRTREVGTERWGVNLSVKRDQGLKGVRCGRNDLLIRGGDGEAED